MTPTQIVLTFIDRINAHDAEGLIALMASDHRFVDSIGHSFHGREGMRTAWAGYFAWFPDYRIEVEDVLAQGDLVLVTGQACGTFAVSGQLREENFWTAPVAWKALTEDGQITHWQVYADNHPVREIMKKYETPEDD
ncbi:MAG: nuclear transport factor 2 family protein [Anaerolineales bacterium]|nr:nuclear transport factor 2 family protein [Anaerolineales bacterium]